MFVLAGIRTAVESCSGLVTLDGARAFSWTLNLAGNTSVRISNIQTGAAYTFKIVQPPAGGCSFTFLGPSFDVYARSLVTIDTTANGVSYVLGVGSDQNTVTIGPNAPTDPALPAPLALAVAYDPVAPELTVTFDQNVAGPNGPGYPLGTVVSGTSSLIDASTSDGSADIVYSLDAPFVPGETPAITFSAGNGITNIEGTPLAVPVSLPIPVGPAPIDPESLPDQSFIYYADDITPRPGSPSSSGHPFAQGWSDRTNNWYLEQDAFFTGSGQAAKIGADPVLGGRSSLLVWEADGPGTFGRLQPPGPNNSPYLPAQNGPWTLYFVGYRTASQPISYAGGWGQATGPNLYVATKALDSGTPEILLDSGSFNSRGAAIPGLGIPFIHSVVFPGPDFVSADVFVNDVAGTGTPPTAGALVTQSVISIGGLMWTAPANPAFFWNGAIGCYLLFKAAHSTATRQGVEAFLANYYGIPYP